MFDLYVYYLRMQIIILSRKHTEFCRANCYVESFISSNCMQYVIMIDKLNLYTVGKEFKGL